MPPLTSGKAGAFIVPRSGATFSFCLVCNKGPSVKVRAGSEGTPPFDGVQSFAGHEYTVTQAFGSEVLVLPRK